MAGMGCISARAYRVGAACISVRCSLVCRTGSDGYLRVIPQETQWIDVDLVATYEVQSNRDWSIEREQE